MSRKYPATIYVVIWLTLKWHWGRLGTVSPWHSSWQLVYSFFTLLVDFFANHCILTSLRYSTRHLHYNTEFKFHATSDFSKIPIERNISNWNRIKDDLTKQLMVIPKENFLFWKVERMQKLNINHISAPVMIAVILLLWHNLDQAA